MHISAVCWFALRAKSGPNQRDARRVSPSLGLTAAARVPLLIIKLTPPVRGESLAPSVGGAVAGDSPRTVLARVRLRLHRIDPPLHSSTPSLCSRRSTLMTARPRSRARLTRPQNVARSATSLDSTMSPVSGTRPGSPKPGGPIGNDGPTYPDHIPRPRVAGSIACFLVRAVVSQRVCLSVGAPAPGPQVNRFAVAAADRRGRIVRCAP